MTQPIPFGNSALYWEAYAAQYIGPEEHAQATIHIYSANDRDEALINLGAGRVSLIEGEGDWRNVWTLAFRGTDNAANIVNDLTLGVRTLEDLREHNELPFSRHEIHMGFLREYKNLRSKRTFTDLLSRIKKMAEENSEFRILLTGHSLGGAVATVCVADILMNTAIGAHKIALITFGSPRVGNDVFASWIDHSCLSKNLRVEVVSDPVVSQPAQDYNAFVHRGLLTAIRKQNRTDFIRVETGVVGEQFHIVKEFGNQVSVIFRPLDFLIDPSISRGITSFCGAFIDQINGVITAIESGDEHFLPGASVTLHFQVRYQQYDQFLRDATKKRALEQEGSAFDQEGRSSRARTT